MMVKIRRIINEAASQKNIIMRENNTAFYRSNMHFDIQGLEFENCFWLRINLKTITTKRIAIGLDKGRLVLRYILPDVTVSEGELKIEELIKYFYLPLPGNLDLKNYRKESDNKSVTFTFNKVYSFV
jgi:hypothetical protein